MSTKHEQLQLGDLNPIASDDGTSISLVDPAAVSQWIGGSDLTSPEELESFLQRYHEHIFAAVEAPTIINAHSCAEQGHIREFLEMDRVLSANSLVKPFTQASCRVGRWQLRRLRPLRDHRMVKQYLEASDAGRVRSWHTLVYALVLSVYALPLRQGLVHFSTQVYESLIRNASYRVGLSEGRRADLTQRMERQAVETTQRLLTVQDSSHQGLRVC